MPEAAGAESGRSAGTGSGRGTAGSRRGFSGAGNAAQLREKMREPQVEFESEHIGLQKEDGHRAYGGFGNGGRLRRNGKPLRY